MLSCGSVRLDCRKRGHGRMCGCSTHQPVEAWPNVVNTQFLKLWPIFEDTFLFFSFPFSFRTSFFGDSKVYNAVCRVPETFNASGRGVWLKYISQWGFISGPQHRDAWSVSPTDSLITITSIKLTANRPLEIKTNSIQKLTALIDYVVTVKHSP